MDDPSSELLINRRLWTRANRHFTDRDAERAWSASDFAWGVFETPEGRLRAMGDVAGKDVVELGCGTAYLSAWVARQGGRPVGVDATPAQLATARRCQERFDIRFPLVEANAEAVPLSDAGFDLVVSEYGASLWCDPERWVAEAARLLRPGGRLAFLTNSVLLTLCVPDGEGLAGRRLRRAQPEIYRKRWPDGGVEYQPGHGDWVRILRANGFVVEALHELYAGPNATEHPYYQITSIAWARKWPAEELWVAFREGAPEPRRRS